jgi:hemolysin III
MNGLAEKPSLRGVSHQIAFFGMIAATLFVLAEARARVATASVLVFGLSLAALFGTSALYHRFDWSSRARRWLKCADHAAIFVAMAGGYTPVFALVPSGGPRALVVIWLGAAIGALKSLLWPDAPKRLNAVLYAGFGWAVAFELSGRASALSPLSLALLVASGILYTVGAIVFASERPNPFPRVFGYHEVFHALIVLGTGCLFGHVLVLVRTA